MSAIFETSTFITFQEHCSLSSARQYQLTCVCGMSREAQDLRSRLKACLPYLIMIHLRLAYKKVCKSRRSFPLNWLCGFSSDFTFLLSSFQFRVSIYFLFTFHRTLEAKDTVICVHWICEHVGKVLAWNYRLVARRKVPALCDPLLSFPITTRLWTVHIRGQLGSVNVPVAGRTVCR